MKKRVFLIVIDSMGIGEMPDSYKYGDEGSNTLLACSKSKYFSMPNMASLGLFNIDDCGLKSVIKYPKGAYCKLSELSKGKDTTTGHWEIAGYISQKPLPVFPNGFPKSFIDEFSGQCGRECLCNKPYSGTEVIKDYGEEHIKTGKLIVYTSADSVFQIAAHEDIISVNELYKYCEIARGLLKNELAVGRVIARPFIGEYPDFIRTSNRHDFSLEPPADTILDIIKNNNMTVYSIGKIVDIFAGKGISIFKRTEGNTDGINKLLQAMDEDFEGLCFVNLVDFDSKYGHRNDVDGYAKALNEFDKSVSEIIRKMKQDDLLIITADHGCDPSTPSTDHSREYIPVVMFSQKIVPDQNFGILNGFDHIGNTVLNFLGIEALNHSKIIPLKFSEEF